MPEYRSSRAEAVAPGPAGGRSDIGDDLAIADIALRKIAQIGPGKDFAAAQAREGLFIDDRKIDRRA